MENTIIIIIIIIKQVVEKRVSRGQPTKFDGITRVERNVFAGGLPCTCLRGWCPGTPKFFCDSYLCSNGLA